MKKRVLIGLAVAVAFALVATAAMAANGLDTWQIGTPHGAVDPRTGASEYPATKTWYQTFDYYVETDSDPVNHPSMPGLMGNFSVHEGTGYPGHPGTDAAANLNIHFALACNYDSSELTIIYDRYGSESDRLYLDAAWFATISATEGGFRHFLFPLGNVSIGNHVLTIEYAGGGSGNGHYIDYLELQSTFVCVGVDIKPGSYPNCFNINGHGVIPVAILGSADFDVNQIDIFTLSFGGLAVRVKGNNRPQCSFEDVSGDFTYPEGAPDGYVDLVCQFVDDAGTWVPGDSTATVNGNLLTEYGGTPIEGSDSICIRPPE